mmetsp:Transcript_20177/g.28404  ORF Transcript_20177/g.28404 Transcript_20177/m.28404 type:complete len:337 (-) Transcript_20177:90-1100(-)
MQITKEAEYLGGPDCVQQIIGGANFKRQSEALRRKDGLVLLVGTPGRLFDHIEKGGGGSLLSRVDTVVLDEADELLSESPRNNYLQHLKDIMAKVRRVRGSQYVNLLLVSASISPSIMHRAHVDMGLPQMRKVSAQRRKEPKEDIASRSKEHIPDAEPPLSLPPGMKHYVVFSHERHRADMTRRIIHATNASRALVFVNYDKQVKDVVFKIQREGLSMSWLEASMRKAHRREQLDKFREGVVRALVVTDIMARGLDILSCDVVVNLHPPRDVLNYVHRAGRTGRLGRAGTVVTILSQRDRVVLKKLRRSLSHIEIMEAHVKNGTLHKVQVQQGGSS